MKIYIQTDIEEIAGFCFMEKIAEASVRLASELKTDPVPQGPVIDKPFPAWSYGNNPPQVE